MNCPPFQITFNSHVVELRGDFDQYPKVLSAIRETLKGVPRFSNLTIVAHEACLGYDALTIWIDAVEEFLMGCKLTYTPSELALGLQYDDRYHHTDSKFLEYGQSAEPAAIATEELR